MQRKDCDAGAGSMPVAQAFGGCGISQSLNERVIDWGEPGTAGNNFVMGETFRQFDTNHLHWEVSLGTC